LFDVRLQCDRNSVDAPRVLELIEAARAALLYLSPYSSNLNPIEQAFSKLKAHLGKTAETTVPGLFGRALATFSPYDGAVPAIFARDRNRSVGCEFLLGYSSGRRNRDGDGT
jgi:transposase